MDAKITLSFDEAVIENAKKYAAANNISLSRLIEFLLRKATSSDHATLEAYPVADWVNLLAEGEVAYQRKPKTRKELSAQFHEGKK